MIMPCVRPCLCSADGYNAGMKPLSARNIRVYGKRDEYCAWPSIARLAGGALVVAFCRSEEHLGPSGEILVVRSTDNGETWSEPVTVYNSIIDDRESGFTLMTDGTLIMHMWSTHHKDHMYLSLSQDSYEGDVLRRWINRVNSSEYRNAAGLEGGTTAISRDGGKNWTPPVAGPDSIHGGCILNDGTALVASYRNRSAISIYEGDPAHDGESMAWKIRSQIPTPVLRSTRFGEPHIAALPSGRVVAALRSTAIPYNDMSERNLLWMTYSDDAGRTWAEAYPTPLWGFPPHLLVLNDGRLLCTYGYRRTPFGQRACISEDGVTWRAEQEIVIRDDAENLDLGYPASAQIDDRTIITVYYQPPVEASPARMKPPDPDRAKPEIVATVWELP